MSVDAILDWLGELSIGTLYIAIGFIAALENVFPPFPSDVVVAFGSFLAARGEASPYNTFAIAWAGNVAGAFLMYYAGRRYGSSSFMTRLERWAGAGAEQKLLKLYGRYGLPALFISRFIPAVRAIVPPFAGAMRLPALPVALAISSASAIWFALITFLAYRAGANWDVLYATMVRSGKIIGFSASGLAVLVLAIAFIRYRRRRK